MLSLFGLRMDLELKRLARKKTFERWINAQLVRRYGRKARLVGDLFNDLKGRRVTH